MAFSDIERQIEMSEAQLATWDAAASSPVAIMDGLLAAGERVLEEWIIARRQAPTDDRKEGFRLLALHRQGAKGEPSFNACRETCRELCYYYNLVAGDPNHPETAARLKLAHLVAKHLQLFVSGKMQVENLGEFCCSSRPVRSGEEANA